MVSGMVYQDDGQLIPDPYEIVTIDPSIEWDVRCRTLGMAPLGLYAFRQCRLPLPGEIGMMGPWRIVVAAGGIKDMRDLPWRKLAAED